MEITLNLNDILTSLNNHAEDYEFGKLQYIRKSRRPFRRLPSRHPFHLTDNNWAHHYGGQKEVQFNVSEDEGLLRWGIALSLQPCRQLLDVTFLHPRLQKLSAFLEIHGEHFHRLGFEMWDWTPRGRSCNRQPQRVAEHLYERDSFIFVGKRAPFEHFDHTIVLRDFDFLLPVYEAVEYETDGTPPVLYAQRGFEFQPDQSSPNVRSRKTTVKWSVGESEVSLRHGAIQDALKRELEREGATVGTENRDGRGGFIDLVAHRDGEYEFYEIKTGSSARLAIRNAIGQLLEYAYWPKPARPKRLFVVSEQALDAEADGYLRTLEDEIGLSIRYRQVKVVE